MTTEIMLREAADWDRAQTLADVAFGKVDALYGAALHLGLRALLGRITKQDATDILHEAASANDLYNDFGVDFIQALIADAFDDAAVTAGAFAVEQKEVA